MKWIWEEDLEEEVRKGKELMAQYIGFLACKRTVDVFFILLQTLLSLQLDPATYCSDIFTKSFSLFDNCYVFSLINTKDTNLYVI